MYLSGSKLLTGMVTFSVAAAIMGMPARATGIPLREETPAAVDFGTEDVVTPENARAQLVADAVMAIAGPGDRGADKEERKAVINSAPDKNTYTLTLLWGAK